MTAPEMVLILVLKMGWSTGLAYNTPVVYDPSSLSVTVNVWFNVATGNGGTGAPPPGCGCH